MSLIPLGFVIFIIIATVMIGAIATRAAKSASDFFVAGRSVGVLMNASAISGEYLSAASFMGIAGLVMKNGYDALWYPVGYAAGYLFLLLFIAGPLRRFGAYTIPDFAEGRFDSPQFRKIAVTFVLFIGFFYTMPQMKGAGVTMSSILNWPYWVGIAIVGSVITFNVALGGMKGITLVQGFQYWAKLFAISVPLFVFAAVQGVSGASPALGVPPAKVAQLVPVTLSELRVDKPMKVSFPIGAEAAIVFDLDVVPADQPMLRLEYLSMGSMYQGDYAPVDEAQQPSNLRFAPDEAVPFVPLNLDKATGRETRLPYTLRFKKPVPIIFGWPEPPFPTGIPYVQKSTKIKVKGADSAPANTMTFAPFQTLIEVADGGGNWKVSPARKPEAGEDKIDPISLVAPQDESKPTGQWIVAPHYITKNGELVTKDGKPVVTGAKIEFTKPTEVTLKPGPVPNAAADAKWQHPFGPLTSKHGFPMLYTYSLIIALVCGTAGLPHILVRFYTNPDGRAAKRTTLWVMVMLGAFYVFTPVWGTLGRALMPILYANNATDSAVIKLPTILGNPLMGQILSGVTSAGAFAAFMSTFSGLLVSMSSAFAHDIYGNMLRPQATNDQRKTAFKYAAIGVGVISMGLGLLVETFDIATMVGWAFAIGAASYFPLLLLGSWWKGLTHIGAAAGMLLGGLLSLTAIVCNMLLDKKVLTWTLPPLVRGLLEQPAIWAVPVSLITMALVSLATKRLVPKDIGLKMLRLHAPEELGFSKNYIEG